MLSAPTGWAGLLLLELPPWRDVPPSHRWQSLRVLLVGGEESTPDLLHPGVAWMLGGMQQETAPLGYCSYA